MAEAGSRIPIVPRARRQEILGLPPSRAVHRDLYGRMPFAAEVEVVNAAPTGATTGALRVMAWNAARCTDVDASARFIEASGAGVVLLTEMDWGMARSGQAHTSRELASRLSLCYAFAVEFLELGLGDDREKAEHAGAVNDVGYHGAAILCRSPLFRVRRVPLEQDGGWFDGARGQRRVGGRMALCASAAVGGGEMVFCAVHLESESDPSERLREMSILFADLDAVYPGRPVIIGGDMNTFSISKGDLDDPASRQGKEAERPARFSDPVEHEPLFELAKEHGYDWERSNVAGAPTHGVHDAAHGIPAMKIDWFLSRGVTTGGAGVIRGADPVSGRILSDHEAIVLTLEPPDAGAPTGPGLHGTPEA